MTYKKYINRWKESKYRNCVRRKASVIQSDGCSGVPDFYIDGCLEHDIHYSTHLDLYTNSQINQEYADMCLKWYIQYHSILGRLSPIAWWRYKVLSSKKGLGFGKSSWDSGPRRLLGRLSATKTAPPVADDT